MTAPVDFIDRAYLGPLAMAEGVTRRNAQTILFATFWTIGLVTFLNFMNPYLFEVLGIPAARQGTLAGLLVTVQETVQIAISGLIGAWSDRAGRRRVYVTGLVLLSAGFAAYPMASSEYQLVALRILYAFGATVSTVMLATCLAEYIEDKFRGRWLGIVAITNGLGIITMAVGVSKLPRVLGERGFDEALALRITFWGCAALALLLALIMHRGLQAPGARTSGSRMSLPRLALNGLTLARERPLIALSYVTAFASKGDLVIITTFLSLWVTQTGIAAGMSLGEAIARAGMIFGITSGAALIWPLFMGVILDKVPRLIAVVFAFTLASGGYMSLALVDDPLAGAMIAAAILAGVGEASVLISAGTLVGQAAPAESRGAVLGTFGFAGSLGIVVLTFVGGRLFDTFGPDATFLMMSGVNAVVALGTVVLFFRLRKADAATAPPT